MVKKKYIAFAILGSLLFSFVGCDFENKINDLRCDHDFVEVEIIEEVTCRKDGSVKSKCTLCDVEKIFNVEAYGHEDADLFDQDNNGICDFCNTAIPFLDLVEGEGYEMGTPVAGKVLRFYFDENEPYLLQLMNIDSSFSVFITTFSDFIFNEYSTPSPFDIWGGPMAKNVPVYSIQDNFVDIYFEAKLYLDVHSYDGPGYWTINEETVLYPLSASFPSSARIVVMEKMK